MKLRKKDPWKSASEYSKDLSGLTINLLVKDIKHSINFLQKIINAKIIYQDPDFAAIEGVEVDGVSIHTILMVLTRF